MRRAHRRAQCVCALFAESTHRRAPPIASHRVETELLASVRMAMANKVCRADRIGTGDDKPAPVSGLRFAPNRSPARRGDNDDARRGSFPRVSTAERGALLRCVRRRASARAAIDAILDNQFPLPLMSNTRAAPLERRANLNVRTASEPCREFPRFPSSR